MQAKICVEDDVQMMLQTRDGYYYWEGRV